MPETPLNRIVVDSTVCVNWFVQTRGKRIRGFSLDLLAQVRAKQVHIAQPAFWRAHVAALVLRKRGVDVPETVETLLDVPTRDQRDADVLHLATDIAIATHAELFDTLYHAAAINKGIELVTANSSYVERAGHLGHIRLLSDWAARSRIAERNKRYSQHHQADAPELRQKKR
jgi:predicted nucleic acid-binding protein